MIVETSVKVRLTDEEEECLQKALNIITDIRSETSNYSCEIEFEDDIECVLDEMQANIRSII